MVGDVGESVRLTRADEVAGRLLSRGCVGGAEVREVYDWDRGLIYSDIVAIQAVLGRHAAEETESGRSMLESGVVCFNALVLQIDFDLDRIPKA